ncbi:MAG: DUF488 domain-containing protein [Prevotellaceae bacterium]|jgi:uncharacterized protein (DUF488 family)|nr:DUF488 domain-containing protein [Prevotellaceae bacterium]
MSKIFCTFAHAKNIVFMEEQTVFSIGHGNKTIEKFISELHSFDIHYLIDIRSKPYSKYTPHFSQQPLKATIEREHIKYVYMGQELGGLPTHDPTCFTHDGNVDYDRLKKKEYFRQGLQRLAAANSKGIHICIMCSESKPQECHRSKLIGVELQKCGVNLRHIVDVSKEKTQNQVMAELTKGFQLIDLFGEEQHFQSRKAYI